MATQTQTKAMIPTELQGLRPPGAYSYDEMYRFAQVCQASGLFEDVTDVAQAFVKIAKGQELGLPPTTAMAAFDIIRKRLFIKPWAIAAKINTCGYGSYKVVEQSDTICTIAFRRKYHGEGWMDLEPVSYTIAEAKAHGLVDRSPHWKASPAHMLYQRCMGRGGAIYFPELLAGLTAPPDDTPIPEERHQQNIVDLFGDGSGPGTAYDAPQSTTARKNDLGVMSEPGQPHGAVSGQKPASSPPRDSLAWETLRAHQDDARLPDALLYRIGDVLTPNLVPITESEAHALAGQVLDFLASVEEETRDDR